MNTANKLTVMRIFLIPIFLIFITVEKFSYGLEIATAIFIIASLTDKLDGYIARSRNQVTNFGKFLDPLADKLLVTSALISLVELNVIPGWIAIIIIAREFAVTGLRTIAAADGIVIAASWWGKIKTVIQIIAIICALFSLIKETTMLAILTKYFMIGAAIITIISGIDYFVKNKGVISSNK